MTKRAEHICRFWTCTGTCNASWWSAVSKWSVIANFLMFLQPIVNEFFHYFCLDKCTTVHHVTFCFLAKPRKSVFPCSLKTSFRSWSFLAGIWGSVLDNHGLTLRYWHRHTTFMWRCCRLNCWFTLNHTFFWVNVNKSVKERCLSSDLGFFFGGIVNALDYKQTRRPEAKLKSRSFTKRKSAPDSASRYAHLKQIILF